MTKAPVRGLLVLLLWTLFLQFLLFGLDSVSGRLINADYRIDNFSSDGCSLFPDGWLGDRNLWCDCCYQHDIAYWQGGTQKQRLVADNALAACVKQRTKSGALAEIMQSGVRAGGHPIFPNWYRWGYGWPYGRGYEPLTSSEMRDVTVKLVEYHRQGEAYVCSDAPRTR